MSDSIENSAHERWVRETVERYEKPLTLYAQRLLNDVERARDAVQETFLRLCHQRQNQLEGHLAEWLFSVCRSRSIDMQRKERRMQQLTEHVSPRESSFEEPHQKVEQGESTGLALETLETLPANQKEVLRLKFQHGLSYREIASITSLTVTNVGFLIHTGLKTIRQRMQAGVAGNG
jgi:RNA polymerase sigma factor (sigma-70 family)